MAAEFSGGIMTAETFLDFNPWSKLAQDKDRLLIELPWRDDSISIELNDDSEWIDDLILYPAFTGIYHRSLSSLELIFTPFRMADIETRNFIFEFEGAQYGCRFDPPSDALFKLAQYSQPITAANTSDWRNLRQFRRYLSLLERNSEDKEFQERYKPISFWIDHCPADEAHLIRIGEHLNFYMSYFDNRSPSIVIHESDVEDELQEKRIRYLWDSFPERIRGSTVDPYMLGLWASARAASDTFRQFIYYYQILEYASFYYVTEKTERSVSAVLSAPETAAFPEQAWRKIQDFLANERIDDGAKLIAVVRESIDLETVWKDLEASRACFERTITFDGGYSLSPVISPSTDLNAFSTSGLDKLVNTFRGLRNALVHARERRMSNVISATSRNHKLIRPYVKPLGTVAMQVARAIGV
jgi:hypothetical protein